MDCPVCISYCDIIITVNILCLLLVDVHNAIWGLYWMSM